MRKKFHLHLLILPLALFVVSAACATFSSDSAEPAREKEQLFPGVTYIQDVRTNPRDMVIHILKVNVASGSIRPFVTPADHPNS